MAFLSIRKNKRQANNSIGYLGTGFLRAVEVADLEARLENLQRKMEAEKPMRELLFPPIRPSSEALLGLA